MRWAWMAIGLAVQAAWMGMAEAGVVVTYRAGVGMDDQAKTIREYYDSGKYRMGDMVFLSGEMMFIDDRARAYWRGVPQQFCEAMVKMRAAVQASLPPQYRVKPIVQRKVTRRKVGEKLISGFSVVGYEFFVDGGPSGQTAWVSEDASLAELIELRDAMERKFRCRKNDEQSTSVTSSKLYRETLRGKFLVDDGYKRLVSVERKPLPESMFLPPSGYKRFSDYEAFRAYAGARKGKAKTSSAASMKQAPISSSSRSDLPNASLSAMERSPHENGNGLSRRTGNGDGVEGNNDGLNVDKLKEGLGRMLKSLW